jgi:hypothetical protein
VAATRGYAPIPPEYGYRDFLGVAPYPYAPPLVANLTGELSASATTALAISDYLTAGYKAD